MHKQVILETKLSRQSTALILTTKLLTTEKENTQKTQVKT